MSNQTKIVICLFSCLLLMSIPFINCVQANEIKKEIKEKQENFMDSYIEKFRLFESKLGIENNEEMPVVTSIILFIFWIYWYFFSVMSLLVLFSPPYEPFEVDIVTFILILFVSIPLSFVFEILFVLVQFLVFIEFLINNLISSISLKNLSNRVQSFFAGISEIHGELV